MSNPEAISHWKVGKVMGPQGVRGEVFVLLFAGEAEWREKLKIAQFADESWTGQPEVELAVESLRVHRKQGKVGLVLKLKGLTDRDEASELLKGKYLYIPDAFLRSEEGELRYLREYLHFDLQNAQGEVLGEVTGFSSNGPQDLLEVKGEGGVHLVPLIREWILSYDPEAKTLKMDLPEGLFDKE